LQAALYLGQTEAWQALLVNLTGFGLATAIRVSQGAPVLGVERVRAGDLVLAFVGAALVPSWPGSFTRLQARGARWPQVDAATSR